RICLIPAVWSRVLEHGVKGYDVSSLVESDTGTSATPPELIAAVRDAFPHTVTRVFYGSTEAGPGTVLAHADLARKPGSVGLPQPGVDVRLEDGEVCIKSELLMDGYFDQPDASAEALADGWYHTGDLGTIDDEGYLSIVGRARDVIRTGGENVAPNEVEAALATPAGVREVAVVGVPDATWGEVVCAVIVPEPASGDAVDLDALRSHAAAQLASFKQPRRLEIVDELPRTPATGQVQRPLLVERIAAAQAGSPAASAGSRSRRANFWPFPDGVRGNSSIGRTSSGHFCRARPAASRWERTASSAGTSPFGSGRTNAQACSPSRASGAATTATSATPGMRSTSSSTSRAETFSPPRMMMSFLRATMDRKPSASRTPTSPVAYQPAASKHAFVSGGSV